MLHHEILSEIPPCDSLSSAAHSRALVTVALERKHSILDHLRFISVQVPVEKKRPEHAMLGIQMTGEGCHQKVPATDVTLDVVAVLPFIL